MVWVMQGVERVQHTGCGQGIHSRTASDVLNYRGKLVPGYSTCPANLHRRHCPCAGKWVMASGGVQIYGNASPTFVVGQVSAMLQSDREVLQHAYLRQ